MQEAVLTASLAVTAKMSKADDDYKKKGSKGDDSFKQKGKSDVSVKKKRKKLGKDLDEIASLAARHKCGITLNLVDQLLAIVNGPAKEDHEEWNSAVCSFSKRVISFLLDATNGSSLTLPVRVPSPWVDHKLQVPESVSCACRASAIESLPKSNQRTI